MHDTRCAWVCISSSKYSRQSTTHACEISTLTTKAQYAKNCFTHQKTYYPHGGKGCFFAHSKKTNCKENRCTSIYKSSLFTHLKKTSCFQTSGTHAADIFRSSRYATSTKRSTRTHKGVIITKASSTPADHCRAQSSFCARFGFEKTPARAGSA